MKCGVFVIKATIATMRFIRINKLCQIELFVMIIKLYCINVFVNMNVVMTCIKMMMALGNYNLNP